MIARKTAIGWMLIGCATAGCRNILPNDQPSRLWEVNQLQQSARNGCAIDQSSIVHCKGPMQNARQAHISLWSPITTGP